MNKRIINLPIFFLVILFLLSITFAISPTGSTKIFAITTDGVTGLVADLHLYTIPGSGEVAFITSNSLVGKDTQTTGNIALNIAEEKTNIKRGPYSYIFDIKADAAEVDGPSAGAAMTLLAYSLLSEKPLNPQVGITGTIRTDGSIGAVGGVGFKAQAAAEKGIKLLMIPKGEANADVIEDGEKKPVNLLSYGPNKLGIKVVEVVTIEEVIKFAYTNINEIKVDTNNVQYYFIPEAISNKRILEPMREISANYVKQAKNEVSQAKRELGTSTLDTKLIEDFYDVLNGSIERNIQSAQTYLDKNYLYSSANEAFNARVYAGAIKEISKTPTLLSLDSSILKSKINSLNLEISNLKKELGFTPMDKYEWLIGAQQRIAYAEDALNKIDSINKVEGEETDEKQIAFKKVYDYMSAYSWIEAAKDFVNEAKKSNNKKETKFSEEFITKVNNRIIEVEEIILDANVSTTILQEAKRRFNAALISKDNNFLFATLYDLAFAESYIIAEQERILLENDELEIKISELMEINSINTSIWGNLFLDHSKFFIKTSEHEKTLKKELERRSALNSSYDLIKIASNIEIAKTTVEDYIAANNFEEFHSIDNVGISWTVTKKDTIAVYLYAIAFLLAILLLFLIYVGLKSTRPRQDRISRLEKVNSVLNRLDKALTKKKISDAEYFFMKKNYEKEFKELNSRKINREKIILNLDESKTKLRALEKGINDLDRHYKSGLIIPEDYKKQSTEVKNEIIEIRSNIKEYQHALREDRENKRNQTKSKNNQNILKKIREIILGEENKLKGTQELAKDQEKEEKKEKKQRRKIIQERKLAKWKSK